MGDWLSLLGDIGGSAGSIVSTLISNANQMKLARENMQWQQQENERAYQRDIDFWNMQNQYNSPEAQRQRLEEAGFNPNMAFGNGVKATTGNASGNVSMNPAQAITPALQPYQFGNLGAQLGDRIHQIMLYKQQKKFQDAQIGNIEADTLQRLFKLDVDKETRQYMIDAARDSAEQIRLANQSLRYSNRKLEFETREDRLQEIYELDKLLKQSNINYTDIQRDLAEFNLNYEKDVKHIKKAYLQLQNRLAESHIYLSKNQQNNLIALSSYYHKLGSKVKTETDIQTIAYQYEKALQEQRKKNFAYMTDQEFAIFVKASANDLVNHITDILTGITPPGNPVSEPNIPHSPTPHPEHYY